MNTEHDEITEALQSMAVNATATIAPLSRVAASAISALRAHTTLKDKKKTREEINDVSYQLWNVQIGMDVLNGHLDVLKDHPDLECTEDGDGS